MSANAEPNSWKRRLLRWFLLFVVTPYVAVTMIFVVLQRHFLYPATTAAALHATEAGLPEGRIHDLAVTTRDGLELHGWLVLAEGQSSQTAAEGFSSDRSIILYFPGNSGNRRERVLDLRDFTRLGCDVVIFDYRGYGENPGSPSEEALIGDAGVVWKTLTTDYEVSPERVVIFGESLGGAVAVQLAADLSDDGTPPAGLILNSTFSSMTDVVGWQYPYFPFQFLLLDDYPSDERIDEVTCPIVITHGSEDEMVPIHLAKKLFDAAPAESAAGVEKEFIEIAGAGHNDMPGRVFELAAGAIVNR